MKFNTNRADLKHHYNNVRALVTQMLGHAQRGTLFAGDGQNKELTDAGLVYNSTYGKFRLQSTRGSNHKTEPRAYQVQQIAPSCHAFVIQSGRDLTFKVFCTQAENRIQCEGFAVRGSTQLGQIHFTLDC